MLVPYPGTERFGAMTSSNKRILIVDDDGPLAETLCEDLKLRESFDCVVAGTAADALGVVHGKQFDAIILDVGLPDMDGHQVCRLMRRDGVTSPILMLTAATHDADAILGLDSGANDYITKPCKMGILMARLRAHLRQHERSDDAAIRVGPFTFIPAKKLLIAREGNHKVRLTEKETEVIKYLYRADGRPVRREVLLNEVWGYDPAVTTHTVETHIYRLRRKIGEVPATAAILVTDRGGYKLIA